MPSRATHANARQQTFRHRPDGDDVDGLRGLRERGRRGSAAIERPRVRSVAHRSVRHAREDVWGSLYILDGADLRVDNPALLFNKQHTHAILSFVASSHVAIIDAACTCG